MTAIQEFAEFINNLEKPVVELPLDFKKSNTTYHSIDLKIFTKDIENFDNITTWIKSKNIPDHLQRNIIKVLIGINPPQNVKNELISIVL
jgi:hypothetical protein